MLGQYTEEEMLRLAIGRGISLADWENGMFKIQTGNTINTYQQHTDGSWTNTNANTVYPIMGGTNKTHGLGS